MRFTNIYLFIRSFIRKERSWVQMLVRLGFFPRVLGLSLSPPSSEWVSSFSCGKVKAIAHGADYTITSYAICYRLWLFSLDPAYTDNCNGEEACMWHEILSQSLRTVCHLGYGRCGHASTACAAKVAHTCLVYWPALGRLGLVCVLAR
jgi:hypothetical protein